MSKFIAVCGSPDSEKTVTSLKLAQEIYIATGKRVLFFSPDLTVPILGYLFPHCKESDLYSVGKTFDNTDIHKEDVLRNIVSVKSMPDFGYLGFKTGENKYTYPRPTEDKVLQLFSCMRELAEYIIVDCVSDMSDLISSMSKAEADIIIQIISPNLKCMAYYASNSEQFTVLNGRLLKVMVIDENDVFLPIEEVSSYFKKTDFTLPYSCALKGQSYKGLLSERLSDSKYKSAMRHIVKAVL